MGDGLAAVAERAAAVRDEGAPKLDVLIVDASSGDPTLAMPCPSPAFLVSSLFVTAVPQACSVASSRLGKGSRCSEHLHALDNYVGRHEWLPYYSTHPSFLADRCVIHADQRL